MIYYIEDYVVYEWSLSSMDLYFDTQLGLFYLHDATYTVRNHLQDILESVFSTIKIVAGYNYYGQKNDVYQATNILYHLIHFCCIKLQQNWG